VIVYIFVYSKRTGAPLYYDVADRTSAHLFLTCIMLYDACCKIVSAPPSFGLLAIKSHREPPPSARVLAVRPSCHVCMRFPTHEGSPKNVSLPTLLSANDWQRFPNRAGPRGKTCLSCLSCLPMIGKDFRTEPGLASKMCLSRLSCPPMIGKDFLTEPGLAPKMCLSRLSCPPMIGKDFLTEPSLAPKNVSLLSLLSANDWQGFPNRAEPCYKTRVSPVSPVHQ
jgi:hypothetical protein